jgi:hypothetical protein
VNHGEITAQTIVDADTATITYCPGDYLGAVVFTDPSTGETVGAVVTSDPEIIPPGSACRLDEDGAALVNDTADHTSGDLVTSDMNTVLIGAGPDFLTLQQTLSEIWYGIYYLDPNSQGGQSLAAMVDLVWQATNGKADIGEGPWDLSYGEPLGATLKKIRDQQVIFHDPASYTIQDMMDNLRGTGAYTHADIMAAVAPTDLQPVLDAIDAARGDPVANLREIVIALDALATINGWTLGNVKTWIEAIDVGEVDLSPVLTAISNLASQLTTATTNIRSDITGVSSSLTSAHTKLDQIIEAIGGISISVDLPPLITPETVPDYGTPVAISEAMQIDAAMAGLLVDVIDRPAGVREYPVGNFAMIFRAGYLAFINPLGYVEQPQYLSFNKGLYMPRTCTEAIGVLVKPNQGQTGTVTPFTLNGV